MQRQSGGTLAPEHNARGKHRDCFKQADVGQTRRWLQAVFFFQAQVRDSASQATPMAAISSPIVRQQPFQQIVVLPRKVSREFARVARAIVMLVRRQRRGGRQKTSRRAPQATLPLSSRKICKAAVCGPSSGNPEFLRTRTSPPSPEAPRLENQAARFANFRGTRLKATTRGHRACAKESGL